MAALAVSSFTGMTGWDDQTANFQVTAYRAQIEVPGQLPVGAMDEYAWVMATGSTQFTQVGWAWWPGKQPVVFAYTAPLSQGDKGTWSLGPPLAIGTRPVFQIVRAGSSFQDQYFANGWVTIATAKLSGPTHWQTYIESYGAPLTTCFRQRGWQVDGVWHHLISACLTPTGSK